MKTVFRLAIAVSLVGILMASGVALLADSAELNRNATVERQKDRPQPIQKAFQPCPWAAGSPPTTYP